MSLEDMKRVQVGLGSIGDPVGLLANLFAHAPVGLAVWSPEGYTLLTNAAFFAIFRSVPPPEYNVLEDELLAASGMLPLFQRAFAGETVHVPTFWYDPRELTSIQVSEGRRVAVSMKIFPLFGAGGEIACVAATYEDATETMLAAERSSVAEHRIRLAQQVASVGSFEWNVRTGVNTWTEELEVLHGLAPGTFAGTQNTWERLVHPDDLESAKGYVQQAFDTLEPVEGEWRIVWPDGSVHWIFGRFQVFLDAEDRSLRLIGVNVDITERKEQEEARRRAEVAVQESEDDLRITLDSIGDAVIATDGAGRVTRMNPVAEDLTGWPLAEAKGRDLQEVFHIISEETREVAENPVDVVLRSGTVVGLANHTVLVARDGTERAIADSGAPIRDADGTVRGVVLVFHDQSAERAAERALRRSEARFRRLADAGIIGIVTADIFGNILEANQTFLDMVGYTWDEVRAGQVRWSDITPRQWLQLDDRALVQLEKTGVATAFEKEYFRKDGTRVPILVGIALLERDTDQFVAFTVDLTERKRAEQALQQVELRLRGLEQSGLIGIVVSDTAGNIKEVNDGFLGILGYTREDFEQGRVHGNALDTPERGETDAAAGQQLRTMGIARPWEKELFHKSGRRVPVLMGVAMLDDKMSELLAFVLDLTEQKRTQTALRESEARKAAVMEAALDAIVLMDHHGVITEFNPAAERTFGYARAEVIGKPLADVIIPERFREEHRHGLQRHLADGHSAILGKRIEVSALRRDGTEFPAEVAVVRIRSERAAVFTGYIRDVTDRKQAAEAEWFRRGKEAAEAANRELEAFSYSVAHDLRSPLRGISGWSGTLLEDYGAAIGEDGRGLIERVMSNVRRMSELIDALLALARLSRAELDREAVDVVELAQAVVERLRASDPERAVDFVTARHVPAHADPSLLAVVLENLIGNAWKFTRDQPSARIELGCSYAASEVHYWVRDNGAGFDMAYAKKLFVPFQRLHSPEHFDGTGVGLATVQRIIQRHGGRVWAEGRENEGATFYFSLPRGATTTGTWTREE